MNKIAISEQIKTYGSKELIISKRKRFCYLIICEECQKLHYKDSYEIIKGLKRNKKFFCSKSCDSKYHSTKLEVNCIHCSLSFFKLPSQIKITKNNFCSKSCAATYNNKHKTHGNRRSKLEKIIEDMIITKYPNINFTCNQKKIIGSELDFYFPTQSLAIQINGPLHYIPIYGTDKLKQIQKMDEEKRLMCVKLNIKLVEINCSDDKYLNKNKIQERLSQVEKILEEEVRIDRNTL